MIDFKTLTRPISAEADIPLDSSAPESIISIYNEQHNGKLVAWKSKNPSEYGCIRLNRSTSVKIVGAHYITLFEQKPAKGPGWVGITINNSNNNVTATLFQSKHSKKSLQWLLLMQEELSEFFSLQCKYNDLGYDA